MQRNRQSVTIAPRKYDTAGLPTRYFKTGELEILLHLFESVAARTIVEFGVNSGRNPAAALRNIDSIERYVGIDVTPGYKFGMQCQANEIPVVPGKLVHGDQRFSLIVTARGSFDMQSIPACDVAFIDADHSREGVLNDYALSKKAVRSGGLIIFHDDNCLPTVQVTETLNDLCAAGADIKHISGTWLSYEVQQ